MSVKLGNFLIHFVFGSWLSDAYSYKTSKNDAVDTGDEAIYGMCAGLISRIVGQ